MRGLFAGLNTIDIQFITDRYPRVNKKTLVSRNAFYLGGPAANAAITFSNPGGNASLVTSVGNHLLRGFVLGELQKNSVKLFDISPEAGENDILIGRMCGEAGRISIDKVEAIDTLGAGDIFHGAFCFYYLKENNFAEALKKASAVATESCKYHGTRDWIQAFKS
jgi:sugar/nucleoside kinase (ribokinase family)